VICFNVLSQHLLRQAAENQEEREVYQISGQDISKESANKFKMFRYRWLRSVLPYSPVADHSHSGGA
jgi:hypothetical protein